MFTLTASALPAAASGAFRPVDTVLTLTVGPMTKPVCTYVRRSGGTPAYTLCLVSNPDAYTGFVHSANLVLMSLPPSRVTDNLLWWSGPYHGMREWDFYADDPDRSWRTTPTRRLGRLRFRIVNAVLAPTPRSTFPYERDWHFVFKKLSVRVVLGAR
jgi:hypothetical protein